MTETTLKPFPFTQPAATEQDDSDVARRLREWLLRREDDPKSVRFRSSGTPRFFPAGSRQAVVTRDDKGNLVVSDPVGAAYGVGATYAEAVAEWVGLARAHYVELLGEEHRLHPRMRRQLEYLASLFG